MAGIQLQTIPNSSRVHRRPRHKFKFGVFPYTLTPFMCSAVWPGESLVNSWFEAREVSPPLANPLLGWGSEWYLFYCKLSDVVAHPEVLGMLVDPTNAPLTGTGPNYDTSPQYYHKGPGPNYLRMCTERIVETYFRDVEEAPGDGADATYDTLWKVKYKDHAIFDSLTPEAIDDMAVPPAASGMDDLARAQDLYDYLVATQLTDLSYSDWCAAYGVKIPKAELNEPELLVKFTEWVYPSNTVDPATGTPSSAISLVVKKSFNEARYFKEPGFICGYHVLRPKIYSQDQLAGSWRHLNTALAWLPAMLSTDPATSLREFVGADILADAAQAANKFIVDVRDVPMYGDQWTNEAAATAAGFMSMGPADRLQYPTNTDLVTLFKSPAADRTSVDGFINLDIVGRIVDYTTAHTSSG